MSNKQKKYWIGRWVLQEIVIATNDSLDEDSEIPEIPENAWHTPLDSDGKPPYDYVDFHSDSLMKAMPLHLKRLPVFDLDASVKE